MLDDGDGGDSTFAPASTDTASTPSAFSRAIDASTFDCSSDVGERSPSRSTGGDALYCHESSGDDGDDQSGRGRSRIGSGDDGRRRRRRRRGKKRSKPTPTDDAYRDGVPSSVASSSSSAASAAAVPSSSCQSRLSSDDCGPDCDPTRDDDSVRLLLESTARLASAFRLVTSDLDDRLGVSRAARDLDDRHLRRLRSRARPQAEQLLGKKWEAVVEDEATRHWRRKMGRVAEEVVEAARNMVIEPAAEGGWILDEVWERTKRVAREADERHGAAEAVAGWMDALASHVLGEGEREMGRDHKRAEEKKKERARDRRRHQRRHCRRREEGGAPAPAPAPADCVDPSERWSGRTPPAGFGRTISPGTADNLRELGIGVVDVQLETLTPRDANRRDSRATAQTLKELGISVRDVALEAAADLATAAASVDSRRMSRATARSLEELGIGVSDIRLEEAEERRGADRRVSRATAQTLKELGISVQDVALEAADFAGSGGGFPPASGRRMSRATAQSLEELGIGFGHVSLEEEDIDKAEPGARSAAAGRRRSPRSASRVQRRVSQATARSLEELGIGMGEVRLETTANLAEAGRTLLDGGRRVSHAAVQSLREMGINVKDVFLEVAENEDEDEEQQPHQNQTSASVLRPGTGDGSAWDPLDVRIGVCSAGLKSEPSPVMASTAMPPVDEAEEDDEESRDGSTSVSSNSGEGGRFR